MPVALHSVPTSNTLTHQISLFQNGAQVAALAAGAVDVLALVFDDSALSTSRPGF